MAKGVEYLLKKNKVELIMGEGFIESPNRVKVGDRSLGAKNIIIATGSSPRQIPGFPIDETKVLSSTGALMLEELPKDIIILGAGAIGMEFAHILNSFGVEVCVVEMMDSILPLEDKEAARVLHRALQKRGIKFHTSTKAISMEEKDSGRILVILEDAKGNRTEKEAEKILVAVGRQPNTHGIGLENLGIETIRGFCTQLMIITRQRYKGVFAIGDIVDSPLLAHVASKEGEIAAEFIAGHEPEPRIDPNTIPSAVYSEPQIASFGYTEERAIQEGISYEKAVFPYRGAGKSVAIENRKVW